jgi:hypothetical protein
MVRPDVVRPKKAGATVCRLALIGRCSDGVLRRSGDLAWLESLIVQAQACAKAALLPVRGPEAFATPHGMRRVST